MEGATYFNLGVWAVKENPVCDPPPPNTFVSVIALSVKGHYLGRMQYYGKKL